VCDEPVTQISQTANGFVWRGGIGFVWRGGDGFVWREWLRSAPDPPIRPPATGHVPAPFGVIRIAKEPPGPEGPPSSSPRHATTVCQSRDHRQDSWPHSRKIGTDFSAPTLDNDVMNERRAGRLGRSCAAPDRHARSRVRMRCRVCGKRAWPSEGRGCWTRTSHRSRGGG
jgi:hypothetical protein